MKELLVLQHALTVQLYQFLRGHVSSADVLRGRLTLADYRLQQVADGFVIVFNEDGGAAFVVDLGLFAVLLSPLFNNGLEFDGKIILQVLLWELRQNEVKDAQEVLVHTAEQIFDLIQLDVSRFGDFGRAGEVIHNGN